MSMTKTVIAVVISTSLGDISLELDKEKAPGTVENFINLVESVYVDVNAGELGGLFIMEASCES